jgi:hypothetical protein
MFEPYFAHFVIGTILICVTVVIHALVLDGLMGFLEQIGPTIFKTFKGIWKSIMLTITVLCVFCAHIVQMWLWAFVYLLVGALPAFEEALYFSTSTFTTVGYGDVVLGQDWRLLGSFQSANGFILFGWSTAFIFEVMSKLYKDEKIRKTEPRA